MFILIKLRALNGPSFLTRITIFCRYPRRRSSYAGSTQAGHPEKVFEQVDRVMSWGCFTPGGRADNVVLALLLLATHTCASILMF